MKKLTYSLLALSLASAAVAATPTTPEKQTAVQAAREAKEVAKTYLNVRPLITINGIKEQNKLTPGATANKMKVINRPFGPEAERPFVIRANGSETTGQTWTEYSVTFIPEKEGYLWLSLEGEYTDKKDKPNFKVDYDTLTITGAILDNENGDFEVVTADGKPKGWSAKEWLPTKKSPAATGIHYITASADKPIGTSIRVTAKQEVTIRFNARAPY